jgi:EAL domain-containing protein (putative c-di-GMP-specific phosphodiesterase class I)
LDPHFLDLEMTESDIMRDVERGVKILQSLSAMGVKISIDDFGTGYSSLSYLTRFPLDTLKIDRSFVIELPHDKNDAAIAETIISMAKSLHLKVVAEGVENFAQFNFLRDRGCDEIQGFLFSRPVPKDEFEHLLKVRQMLEKNE